MKKFSQAASLMTAAICISFAVSGCGSNSSTTGSGVGGAAVYSGGLTTLPGGGAQLSFSGSNIFDDSVEITGLTSGGTAVSTILSEVGGMTTGAQCALSSCQYGAFGPIGLGSMTMSVGQTGTITCVSHYDPGGSQISLVTTPTSGLAANVSGVLTLSPQFISTNFGSMPSVQGLYFDMFPGTTNGGSACGGVVVVCTTNTCQHGAYLQF